MKPTAMISQPMGGLTEEVILAKRKKAIEYLEDQGYEVLDTYYKESAPENVNQYHIDSGLWYLGRSLMDMAKVDLVYFCEGWESARGCLVEYEAALHYGSKIRIEDMPDNKTLHNFGEALILLKSGCRMTRKHWDKQGIFVVYQKGYPDGIPFDKQTAEAWNIIEGDMFKCDPYFQINTTDGSHVMWQPTVRDCLAEDWYIVDRRYFQKPIESNE